MVAIEVIKEIDELNREVYKFCVLYETSLKLNEYALQNRETKRHKFKNKKYYDRLRDRSSTIDIDDIVLTEDIKQEAINIFISRLAVTK
jgi:hypothetical protein